MRTGRLNSHQRKQGTELGVPAPVGDVAGGAADGRLGIGERREVPHECLLLLTPTTRAEDRILRGGLRKELALWHWVSHLLHLLQ